MKGRDNTQEPKTVQSEPSCGPVPPPDGHHGEPGGIRNALMESETRYRSLFEESGEGIAILTPDGTIAEANQAFADLVGMGRAEMPGLSLNRFSANPRDLVQPEQDVRQHGFVRNFEWKVRTRDGLQKDCLVTFSVHRSEDGEICGFQSIVRDVTEQRQSLESLFEAEHMRALGEVAAAAAYTFRNLLQIMVAGTRLALSNLDSSNVTEARTNLEQVLVDLRSAGDTARLLNQFASVRRDRPPAAGRVFDLSRTVEKAVEICVPLIEGDPEREGIKISLSTSIEPGCFVKGIETNLLEVALNLIWNAAEALPRGGRIVVSTALKEDNVVLRVQDTGVGIASENLGKVFQPFFTTKGPRGTGLGLASSFGLVRGHGGRFSVESKEGEGTAFTVVFPVPHSLPKRPKSLHPGQPESGLRLLVVDDLRSLLSILKQGLTKRGQKVYTAASGEEAVKMFQEHEIDAVVCDLAMPGMSGWQVGARIIEICRTRGNPKPPFILLTGWGGQVDQPERIAESGVDAVVQKPMDIPRLLEVIRELVLEHRQHHGD